MYTDPNLPADQNDPYWQADHPDHKSAVARVQEQMVARTQEMTRDDVASRGAPQLPKDRTHPYWNESDPRHKEAVEAVTGKFRTAFEPKPGDPYSPLEGEAPHEITPPPAGTTVFPRGAEEDYGAMAQEVGLGADLAQACLDAFAVGAPLPELPHSSYTAEASERELRYAWGAEYKDRLAVAKWAARSAGPHVLDALEASGMGNDPRVIEFFCAAGAKAMREQIMATPGYQSGASNAVAGMTRMLRWSR